MEEILSKSTYGRRRAGLAAIATTALVAGACAAGAGAASADTGFHFQRIGGADRYETAALVSDALGQTDNAIIANGSPGNYADALTANYLAGVKNAPILLTKTNNLPDYTKQQLADAKVKNVWIVGGEGVVSAAQEQQLKDLGYTVNRVAGHDRFATDAQAIALGGAAKRNVAVVATGFDFPDALAGGPLAATGSPLALAAKDNIDDSVIKSLQDAGVTHAIILGGTDVVGPEVEAKLTAAGITVDKRLFGHDRADTSVAVAKYEVANFNFVKTGVNVASGYTLGYGADALAGGPLTGKENRPLLITKDVNIPGASVLQYLTDNANTLHEGIIFGKEGAVSVAAQAQMEKAAQSVTSNQSYSVTPQDKATLGATNDSKSERTYTVSGLDDTKTYNLALFEAKNVDTTSGQVKFADNEDANNDGTKEGNDVADQGSPDARITSVNNGSAVSVTNTTVKPVNGTVKFTINSAAPDDVVPVVWLDSTTGKTGLDLNADNTPSEKFAVGGETVYTPQAAANGTSATQTVVSNDEAANTFVGSTGATSTQRTFSYDSNDVYTDNNGHQITMDAFEKALSTDDEVTPTYYYTDPSLVTTWKLNDLAPGNPTAVSATPTKGAESTSLTVTWTAPSLGSPDTYNVYREKAGLQSSPTSLDDYTKVGTVSGDTTKFVDSGLTKSTTYYYTVTAVDQGDESTGNPATPTSGTTAASNATDQDAPKAIDTVLTTAGGLGSVIDSGDVFKVVFNEPIAAPTAGDTIRAKDGDSTPTVADFVNGTNSAFTTNAAAEKVNGASHPAGTVLTVTVTGAPTTVDAGTTGGLQIPATITDQSGTTDVAGNRWVVSATGQDVVIDDDSTDNNNNSGDTTAPAFDQGASDTATAAATHAAVYKFTEAIDPASVSASDFTTSGAGTIGTPTVSNDGKTITVPVTGATQGDTVKLVAGQVTDLAGNPNAGDEVVTLPSQA
ncbi:MAG: cell wall-binding repeat-containing protein [Nocardioidaceae bacterium]